MEERDPHYAGVLGVRKRQVSGLDITVEAAARTPRARPPTMVRESSSATSFEDELRDILDAIGKGFSCTEIVWDTSEGQWRPKRLAWRDPRWFTFDQVDGETPLLRNGGSNVPLNPYQWIFHKAKVKSGLPIRGGLARGAAWTFLFKSFTVKDWAIFCEAYGQPLRLGKYDAGASERDKEKLLEAVSNIGTDYAAIVPVSMAIEFVKADICRLARALREARRLARPPGVEARARPDVDHRRDRRRPCGRQDA
jgi:phage gp29-like protein